MTPSLTPVLFPTSFPAVPALILLALSTAPAAERLDQELGSDWRFLRAAATVTTPTADWSTVTIPHSWNAQDILPLPSTGKDSPSPTPYRGVGWYQRTLTLDPAWRNRRVFLRCEAASLVSRVHLNGETLGEHRGGFTAFCYELTPHLDWTGSNDLRIQVDNSLVDDVAPISGDFNVQGGLYRPVHLIVTDPVCISPLDHASSGVYVTQEAVSDIEAKIAVRTVLSGTTPGQGLTITTELLDDAGRTVASDQAPYPATPSHTATLTVAKPHRWQGRLDPYLYTCRVTVGAAGQAGDRVENRIGLRTVAISNEQGFLLNGLPYPIHGVNRHQDVQGKGWALEPADHDRDLALITEMGATAIRLAHYPQSGYLHAACDANGLLLWNEVPLVDKTTDSPAFTANAQQQMAEMVHQLGNHPSVAFWGLYNEIRGDFPRNAALLTTLKQVIQDFDRSRLIVGATCVGANPMHLVPDWNCWNTYPGWYSREAGGLGEVMGMRHREIKRRVGVSEYGAGANPAHHQEDETLKPKATTQVFHPEEFQAYSHEKNWASIKDRSDVWGTFIWNMFDFSVVERNEGGFTGLNDKGMITYDRQIKKDVFFFYKANWNPEPMLHLCSQRFTRRQAPTVTVKAYANGGPATLSVNGTTIGEGRPDEVNTIRWTKVPLAVGANAVVVRASWGGRELESRATWTWDPAAPGAP